MLPSTSRIQANPAALQPQPQASSEAQQMALLKQLGLGDNQARWLATAHGQALHDALLSSRAPLVLKDNGHGGFTVESVPVLPGQTEKRRLPEGFGPLALALAKWAPQASLALLDVARACPADPATAKAVVNAWQLAEAEAGADASGMSTEEDASEGSTDVAEDTSNTFEAVSGSPDGSSSAEASASDSDDSGSEMSLPFEGAAAVPLTLSAQALAVQQGNGAHELLDAINKNALERVRKVLSNEPLLNANLAQQGSPLRVAVELGKKEIVEFLLNQNGIDVNEPDDNGFTPLHLAVDEGNADIVALFLKHSDTKVNALSVEGVTPLYLAMYRNHPKIAALLFDHGADLHQHDNHHVTPLHIACSNGNLVAVEWMMKLPAFLKQSAAAILNLNAADNDKVTPLLGAVQSGNQKLVQLLLTQTGIDPNTANDEGTPLHMAIKADNNAMGNVILKYAKTPLQVDAQDTQGHTPLFTAVARGNMGMANMLLAHGADITHAANGGVTALHQLCAQGEEKAVRWLLTLPEFKWVNGKRRDMSVAMNIATDKGETPLQLAARSGNLKLVSWLLAQTGINPTPADKQGVTPLHDAAAGGYIQVVEHLLTKTTVDVNCMALDGTTPFFLAIEEDKIDMAQWLANKADINKAEKTGVTPIHLVCLMGKLDVASWLLPAVVAQTDEPEAFILSQITHRGRTPLQLAVRSGNEALVKDLLGRKGCAPNHADSAGWTPLLEAVGADNAAIVALLLPHPDVDVDLPIKDQTPFFHAMAANRVEIAKLLLKHGADIHKSTDNDITPLHIVCELGHTEAVRWLLSEIAKLNSQASYAALNAASDSGMTPLLLAIKGGHKEVVQALLEHTNTNPNQPDWQGRRPLHYAASGGLVDIAQLLLNSADTKVDAETLKGTTPLHFALEENQLPTAQLLIDHGADLHKRRKDGNTALHIACGVSTLETVEWLLSRLLQPGATPTSTALNAGNKAGATPLQTAARKGRADIVRCLLNQPGIAPHKPDREGRTPLHQGARAGNSDIVSMLLRRPEVHVFDEGPYRHSVLYYATISDNPLPVIEAIRSTMTTENFQVLVHQPNEWGSWPISAAVRLGKEEAVIDLLKTARVVPKPLPAQRTPIQPRGWVVTGPDMSTASSASLVKQASQGGIEMHTLGDGKKDLAWKELVDLDIQGGDVVYWRSHAGFNTEFQTTMVHLAEGVEAPMADVARLMQEKGAISVFYTGCGIGKEGDPIGMLFQKDPTIRPPASPTTGDQRTTHRFVGRDGPTLTELNVASGRQFIANIINERKSPTGNLSAPPTRSVQPEITVSWNPQQRQWEVTRQAALTLDELKGMTGSATQKAMEDLMFMHCNDANLDAVGQLLAVHKVDPNITIPPGYTPLHLAAAAGHEALVNLLLKHGADINRFDNEGEPPIHCAISSGDLSMCNLLLRKGAEPNPKLTHIKATHPLALAVYQGHVEITKALLNAGARRNARLPNGRTAMDIALEKRHLEIVKLLK